MGSSIYSTHRKDSYYTVQMDEWIIAAALGKEMSILMTLHFNICAIVLHFDRNQTTAAVPFRSVDEGPGRGKERE